MVGLAQACCQTAAGSEVHKGAQSEIQALSSSRWPHCIRAAGLITYWASNLRFINRSPAIRTRLRSELRCRLHWG